MSIQAIQKYHKEVHEILRCSGITHEQAIKDEFASLIKHYCKQKNLSLGKEKTIKNKNGKDIRPDGTITNSVVDLGYWESKANVKLEKEITAKKNAGYPLSNTLFQDDKIAILYQDDVEVAKALLTDEINLDNLLNQFINFKCKEIKEFYTEIDKFKQKLPSILKILRNMIAHEEQTNIDFVNARKEFLTICEKSINPNISINDINEMLLQHILTEDIFINIFTNAQFIAENNIAKELYKLENTFFKGETKLDTLDEIQSYYAVIKNRAASIVDHHDKQAFLKAFYEDFYKIYNPKAADKMGVVYTPNEIVKFQIESVDYLLNKHFKKKLSDEGIKILDPCVGTGTYICDLIDYLPPHRLQYKYENDIYANELGLLPYYIANLNIMYTYKQKMGKNLNFNNICWVDTLDNTGFNFKGTNTDLFGISAENTERIKSQNEQQISVIIGNPPYNAKQENYNQQNANRLYKAIDDKIKTTYIKNGSAQNQIVLYDMYTRFYRWATDRINNEQGIIAFITNNSFINAKSFDGFRKCISQEFDFAYIIDLGGDIRANYGKNLKISNVFNIQTGVALMFLVKTKTKNKQPCKIFYISLQDEMLKSEKLNWLSNNKMENIEFDLTIPNDKNDWINQIDNNFDSLIPVCDKNVKSGDSKNAIFKLFSSGVKTQRDEWVYDFNKNNLENKVRFFIEIYQATLKNAHFKDKNLIKWDAELDSYAKRSINKELEQNSIVKSIYRPFTRMFFYFDKHFNGRTYQWFNIFNNKKSNKIIWFKSGTEWSFFALAVEYIADVLPQGGSQCLPLYFYDKEGNQYENITDWALEQFQSHYNHQEITKEQIFNYVYAVLHDPHYRQKYEQNLKRDFPRIPFYSDFEQWTNFGKKLINLHLNYETVEKYPLTRIDTDNVKIPTAKLKADKPEGEDGMIQLDDNTRLENVPCEAWEYLLGNRSALEWVLDQYKEKTPKDATIAANFNSYKFADHKEHVIDLLCRVCKVSVDTVSIVRELSDISPLKREVSKTHE